MVESVTGTLWSTNSDQFDVLTTVATVVWQDSRLVRDDHHETVLTDHVAAVLIGRGGQQQVSQQLLDPVRDINCVIEIRTDVLAEVDGPMLQFGLQATHGQPIVLPGRKVDRPNADLLEIRYERFRKAS